MESTPLQQLYERIASLLSLNKKQEKELHREFPDPLTHEWTGDDICERFNVWARARCAAAIYIYRQQYLDAYAPEPEPEDNNDWQ